MFSTQARGASRGSVHRRTARYAFSLTSRFGLLCCDTDAWPCSPPKPEARAEGVCIAAQHAERFPSPHGSGFCGVMPTPGHVLHPSPRRETRECASPHSTLRVFPHLTVRAFVL